MRDSRPRTPGNILRLEQVMKQVPITNSRYGRGRSGEPGQKQWEQVQHTLDAYACCMELYHEALSPQDQENDASPTVVSKFTLCIENAARQTIWNWICKKNGTGLLFTPYYCSGTVKDASGQRALSRVFCWNKGFRTEEVCREFIDFLNSSQA